MINGSVHGSLGRTHISQFFKLIFQNQRFSREHLRTIKKSYHDLEEIKSDMSTNPHTASVMIINRDDILAFLDVQIFIRCLPFAGGYHALFITALI